MTFLSQLNPVQKEAAKTVEGPVMIVAGAGSGKTRLLTYRIAYLISIGVPAYQILSLTFTNKAANEMKERITSLVGSKSSSIWMGTFHSMFARILRKECSKIGYESNFTIYDSADSLTAIKNIMESIGISTQRFNPNAIRSKISAAKNALVTPGEYLNQSSDLFEEKTSEVYAEYRKVLKKNNAMDFDDLLLKPIELFEHHKAILEQYQDRFRFILVDEYQDTNKAQYKLIQHLASRYKNICVVGDDAQSIYAFRGADIQNILDFEKDFPAAKVFHLEQNYRSTGNILAAADRVIKNNIHQIQKNLWTENPAGELISLIECEDDRDEGMRIVSRISDDCHRFKIDLKDFAILYRTNAQSRSLEDALRKNNIPYTIVGGIEFYQRKEIKDVLAYLRVLVNPVDNESFLRIVNYPNRGIGDVNLGRLVEFSGKREMTLLEAAGKAAEITELTESARRGLKQVASLFNKYMNLKESLSASELSRSLVDEIGILAMFKSEATREALGRWENVQELLSAISEAADTNPEFTLEKFLEDVALVSDIDQWSDEQNAVTLMTLHSAKGLEFPVVFITGLEEGLFPFYNTEIDKKELEEERRLYYVGITRAKRKLYLSYARSRYRFGDLTYPSPSRFIDEIGEEFVETPARHRQERTVIHDHVAAKTKTRARQKDTTSSYFTDESPDYENESDISRELKVGIFVEHELFGKGRILSLTGSGEASKAVVEFPNIGRKNLLLKYANLKLL
ncbi:MAG: ATP-dependent helicase [Bacteroidota bacterium]